MFPEWEEYPDEYEQQREQDKHDPEDFDSEGDEWVLMEEKDLVKDYTEQKVEWALTNYREVRLATKDKAKNRGWAKPQVARARRRLDSLSTHLF